jgi:prepilin-type N-terminal cleavage/methylation domain-containing protein
MCHARLFRRGTSLIETLVVIAIMGILLSLLLPALQMARESADETACKNNIYQLSAAVRHFVSARKRLPAPGEWTLDLLPYLEEKALAQAIRRADPVTLPEAKFLPLIYTCTAQPKVIKSFVADIPICHYMLVIDADAERRGDRVHWQITDRPSGLAAGTLPPWFVGPEMHPVDFQRLVNEERGPHRSGVFLP